MAQFVLILWIPVALIVFASFRPAVAAGIVFLAGMMFLPEKVVFNFVGLPPFDKRSVTVLCILLGVAWRQPRVFYRLPPGRGVELLFFVLIVGSWMTVVTNGDRLHYGPTVLPALGIRDAISMTSHILLRFCIPFYLGRILFRNMRDVEALAKLVVLAVFVYSFLTLFETRMSPQLHKWVYGYRQKGLIDAYRWGGYRPFVFMQSGLAVGAFMAGGVAAACSLWKGRKKFFSLPTGPLSAYLWFALVMCRSVGALAYGSLFAITFWFGGIRWTRLVLQVVAVLVLVYPTLRITGLFPKDTLISAASMVSERRATSIQFRLETDELLMVKANDRMWFGWGGWDRNQVYNERGQDITITDGYWILVYAYLGLAGWFGCFGLMLIPVFLAIRVLKRLSRTDQWVVLGLCAVVVMRGVDLLPDGWYSSLPLLIAGALTGLRATLLERKSVPVPAAEHRPQALSP